MLPRWRGGLARPYGTPFGLCPAFPPPTHGNYTYEAYVERVQAMQQAGPVPAAPDDLTLRCTWHGCRCHALVMRMVLAAMSWTSSSALRSMKRPRRSRISSIVVSHTTVSTSPAVLGLVIGRTISDLGADGQVGSDRACGIG